MSYRKKSYGSGSSYTPRTYKGHEDLYDDDDDDFYGRRIGYGSRGTYKPSYRKETYTQKNSWSWSSYNIYGEIHEDNDSDLFIKNHDNYFTPTAVEIRKSLPWSYNTNTDSINLIKEFSRFFFYKMLDQKNYIAEKFEDDSTLSEEELIEKTNKVEFYEALWDKYTPGFTPLEKAISLLTGMSQDGNSPNDISKNFKRFDNDNRSALQNIKYNEAIFTDPEYNELLNSEFFNKNNYNKLSILNKIALVKNLGSQFKVEKEIEEKIVANSKNYAKKVMRDYSQVFNIDLYQRLFPNFKYKLLTKDLNVNVPVDKTEHKQKIIILLDFSGSMSNPTKQEWVLAILMDRLKYAIKEEAEIFFSYFVNNPNSLDFTHIYNKETALKFLSTFSTLPNGGDTYIGAMIDRIDHNISHGYLANLKIDLRKEKPEILVINDGQDSVKTNSFSYKTNAISLFQHNEELKRLCVSNNGKYVSVLGDEYNPTSTTLSVETFSKEGNEKLTI